MGGREEESKLGARSRGDARLDREPRADYLEKVTGAAAFASDVAVPEMLHGRILRSPLPHARIRGIDASAALAMPGVVAVLTGADLRNLPGASDRWGLYLRDRPVIAIDAVRYVGDPVAAVAAIDEATAEDALDAIAVDYDPLPHVTTSHEALAEDAPLVHAEMDKLKDFYFRGEASPVAGTNIFQRWKYDAGDVEKAFADAARVFEDTFTFPMVFHFAMEPHVCVAHWKPGSLEIWSGGQTPSAIQRVCSDLFAIPLAAVRVHSPYVGGGFGGKASVKIDPLVAALSWKARRPVRVCLSISESMLTARRVSAEVTLRTAVDGEGRLVAKSVRSVVNGGAYADTGPAIAIKAAIRAIGPYHIPNLHLEALGVYTNTVPGAAFRSIGGPQAVWACESQIDIIAAALGRDPVEYRMSNLAHKGETIKPDLRPLDVDMRESLREAIFAIDELPEPAHAGTRARGVAVAASDPGIFQLIGDFAWKELFWQRRDVARRRMRCFVFGHGCWEQALSPYIGMVAKTVFVTVDEAFHHLPLEAQLPHVDAALARHFESRARFASPRAMAPMPILGVPGWHSPQDEAFYDDASHFRSKPRRIRPCSRCPSRSPISRGRATSASASTRRACWAATSRWCCTAAAIRP